MSAHADVRPFAALPAGGPPGLRALTSAAHWLQVYSDAAVRIAKWGAILAALTAFGVTMANVFCRYVLGFSLIGMEEIASYAFLWAIWMGVSIAVRRGAITVITVVSHHGPAWWRRSLQTFSGLALAALLVYALYWSTRYAASPLALGEKTPALGIPKVYAIASMTVGYYFIALHYLAIVVGGAARLLSSGPLAWRTVGAAIVGAAIAGAALWAVIYGLLRAGADELFVLGVLFVALTLAGTPVVFMLSIVGILSTVGAIVTPDGAVTREAFLGLTFYPNPDPLFPFRVTQNQMGLNGASEFIVVLMFLIVAEVMNASGMSERLIRWAASLVGHLRGGMAYVCQVTSVMVSGISGSAQADAAVMTPLLVPAMQKEGYPRDFAAAVVAGASIKGPVGPLSIMFIVYAVVVEDVGAVSIQALQSGGIFVVALLFFAQAAVIAWIARRQGLKSPRPFAGARAVTRETGSAFPVLMVPFVLLGGIWGGVFTITEAAAAALLVTLLLAFFWYGTLTFRDIPRVFTIACVETGVVMLLLGDSAILARNLEINSFGETVMSFFEGITDSKWVFLLLVNLLLLAVGIFVEPLPALVILAPFLAQVAVEVYDVDPVHFGLIVVLNLVLALIHPPIGLVVFLVSSLAKVPVERLSIRILPWLAVSLVVLALITFMPDGFVTWLPDLVDAAFSPEQP